MSFLKRTDTTINISTVTIIKALVLTVLFFLGLEFLTGITHQVTLIVVAAFLALALNPAVTRISSMLKTGSRTVATGLAYLAVISFLSMMFALVVPPLVTQTVDFVQEVPSQLKDLESEDTAFAKFVRDNNIDDEIDEWARGVSADFKVNGTKTVFSTASRVGANLVSIVSVLVLTFMMLIEGPIWYNRLMRLLPKKRREHHERIIKKMYGVVTGYVNGQVLVASIGATFATVAILIANSVFDTSVNALAMAGVIFIFGLIPMFGAIIGASIVVFVSLFSSFPLALTLAVFFVVYQQIENTTLQPYIQAKNNQLTPLLVFVAALIGIGFGGIIGALAAIPIAGCLKIVIEDRFEEQIKSAKES